MKYHNRILRTANIVTDSAIVTVAMALTFWLRTFITPYIQFTYAATPQDYLWALLLVVPLWNFLLYMNGLYPTNRLRSFRYVFWIIFKATISGIAVCVLVLYIFKLHFVGRLALVFFAFLSFGMLLTKELIVRESLRRSREKGTGLRNVLIVGEKKLIPKIIDTINDNPYLGLNIPGVYILEEDDGSGEEGLFQGVKIFDKARDIRLVLLESHIDHVIIAVDKESLPEVEELILKCEEFGAEIWLYADFFELMFAQKEIDTLGEIPFLVFRTTPQLSWALVFKRVLDIVGSIVFMILFSPIFLLATAVVKLSSPGPVIFKQKRVGLHGRKFVFYKFRSMVSDAEQRRQELLGRNIMTGPVFKIKGDPRITPFGKFMRRTSIDELPQLWNVLRGDMSLVGPRPPLPREVSEYRGWQRRRLSMRPGLTCLWQVQGRNRITDFDKWAELDLQYIDNWSLWLDFVILVKTVFVVLFRIGAE